jgi:hypothetical protein
VSAARERVVARLSDAFARDELQVEELERRLTAAYRAEEDAALQALVADLPARETALVPAPATVPSTDAQGRALAVLGTTTRSGRWRVPRAMRVTATLGNVTLDFRDAELAPGVSEVHVRAVLGSVEIVVPPDLAVETTGAGILGAFEHVARAPARAEPDRPLLRIHGAAVLGSVDVVTRLRGR